MASNIYLPATPDLGPLDGHAPSETDDAGDAAAGSEAARHVAPRAWYALAVLTAIITLNNVDRSVMSILIPPIKGEFALSDSQIGVLVGLAFAVFYAAAAVPMGLWVDRTNRSRLLAGLVLVWSACTALCGLAQGFWSLFAARTTVGLAEAGGSPAMMSMISDFFPPRRRSLAIGIYCAGTAIGAAAAFAIGGFVAEAWGWRFAFLVAGAPGVFLAALLFLTVREPARGGADGPSAPPRASSSRSAWAAAVRNPTFVLSFLGMTAVSIVGAGTLIWAATYLARVQGLKLHEAGLAAGASALVCGTAGTVLGGLIGDRLAEKGAARAALVPAASGVLALAAGLLMVTAPSAGLAIVGLMAWELCFRAYFGPANNLVMSSVDPRIRGSAAAASQVATNLVGWGLGPLIVGVVSDSVGGTSGLRWGLAAVMSLGLVSAALFLAAAVTGRRNFNEKTFKGGSSK